MSIWLQPEPSQWWQLVDDALSEDIGSGDVSGGAIPAEHLTQWRIEAQADGVVCGAGIAQYLMNPVPSDPDELYCDIHRGDGESVSRGDLIAEGRTLARRAVAAERTALNFLMQLSGVATLTAQFVKRTEGTGVRIVDTRKTVPLLRGLQKYAVRCGGGHNHRMGLYDAAMLKDNHIAACGSITAAVEQFRSYASHMTKLEVECETLAQVEEAARVGVDVILLDNMDPFTMREAVTRFKGACLFEASGGITLDTVRAVAQTGVDLISVGALTHSAQSLAFHMEFE